MKRFADEDLTGSEFRECDLSETRLVGVVMQDAVIDGLVTNLVVNGETLPKEFIDRIKDKNFAEQASSNPDLQAGLERVKGVSVQNSQVVLQFSQ